MYCPRILLPIPPGLPIVQQVVVVAHAVPVSGHGPEVFQHVAVDVEDAQTLRPHQPLVAPRAHEMHAYLPHVELKRAQPLYRVDVEEDAFLPAELAEGRQVVADARCEIDEANAEQASSLVYEGGYIVNMHPGAALLNEACLDTMPL